jgi:uncharacterized protein (TIGR00645 family)
MLKKTFENLLFACRWLLIPFYAALILALVALLGKAMTHAYGLVIGFLTLSEEDIILGALAVIDLTLSASLIVLVVFSTYSNFVSRVDAEAHRDWPQWMVGIDFGELKLKLIASIVAIASIKLLEAYMNLQHETDRQLAWQTGIYGCFVFAALLIGIAEAVGHAYGEHE